MKEIVWEGYICDLYDLSEYLRGEVKWDKVNKKKVRFLVDTGASKSIVLEDTISGLRTIEMGKTTAQGVCDKPTKFRVTLLGIAISLDDEIDASIHEVLVPIEEKVEQKLQELFTHTNTSAILGRLSMDSLEIRIHPKTLQPTKIPTLLL
ncbi:MAG: hypothetical protein DRI92_02215 [Aquificota bacterium]|nr:MAG: hypothetical protein DRI92_02215 [Aquificota bacterium]